MQFIGLVVLAVFFGKAYSDGQVDGDHGWTWIFGIGFLVMLGGVLF